MTVAPDLTAKQAAVLTYMIDYQRANGRPVTVRGICAEFGFRSTNAAVANLQALARKGYIASIGDHTSRAWRVLRNPDGSPVESADERLRALLLRCEGAMAEAPQVGSVPAVREAVAKELGR